MLGINSRPPLFGAPTSTPMLRRDTLLGQALLNVVLPGVQVMDLGERVFASSGAASGTLKPGPTGPARNYTGTPTTQYIATRGASSYPFVQVWIGRFNAVGSGPVTHRMVRSASGGSGDSMQIGVASSTQVQYVTRNNFSSTSAAVLSVPGGASVGVDLVIVAQSLSATDHRIYCNGASATDATNSGTPASAFNQMWLCSASGNNDHDTYLAAFGAGIALPDAYALELSRTPAKLFGELLQQPRRRVWSIVPPAAGGVSLVPAAGASTAQALGSAATAKSAMAPAAGVSTAATATSKSNAATLPASASGLSTVGSLAGASVARSALTPASGASAPGTFAASSIAAASLVGAAGVSTASSMASSGGTGVTFLSAAGVSTTGTLGGSSTAASSISPAAGSSLAGGLAGSAAFRSALVPAAGVSTTATMASAVVAPTFVPAAGSSTAGTFGATAVAASAMVPAAGASTCSTLSARDATAPAPVQSNRAGGARSGADDDLEASVRKYWEIEDALRERNPPNDKAKPATKVDGKSAAAQGKPAATTDGPPAVAGVAPAPAPASAPAAAAASKALSSAQSSALPAPAKAPPVAVGKSPAAEPARESDAELEALILAALLASEADSPVAYTIGPDGSWTPVTAGARSAPSMAV